MSALGLGIIAALAWGVHDLLVRYISQRVTVSAAMFTVLLTGIILTFLVQILLDGQFNLTISEASYAGISGVAFAVGFWALYKAFEIGPVRLVAPIIAGFPVITVGWAALTGSPVSLYQWIAVFAVLTGISVVTVLSQSQTSHDQRFNAVILSVISAFGFAVAFTTGQSANMHGVDFNVLMFVRIAALICVVIFAILGREAIFPDFSLLPLLIGMGILDTVALALVFAASPFPNPEYAAVSASISGLVTIYLARLWLKESISTGQWCGVLLSFCGIGYLAL